MSDKKKSKYAGKEHHQVSGYKREADKQSWHMDQEAKVRQKRKHIEIDDRYDQISYEKQYETHRDHSATRYKSEDNRSDQFKHSYHKVPSSRNDPRLKSKEYKQYKNALVKTNNESKSTKYISREYTSYSKSPSTSSRARSPSFSSNESAVQKKKSKKLHRERVENTTRSHDHDSSQLQYESPPKEKKIKKERGRSKEKKKKKYQDPNVWHSPTTSEERQASVTAKTRINAQHKNITRQQDEYEKEFTSRSPSKKKAKLLTSEVENESKQYLKPAKKMHKKEKVVVQVEEEKRVKKHRKKYKSDTNDDPQQQSSIHKPQSVVDLVDEDEKLTKHPKKRTKEKTKQIDRKHGHEKNSEYDANQGTESSQEQFEEEYSRKMKKKKKQRTEEILSTSEHTDNDGRYESVNFTKHNRKSKKREVEEEEFSSRSSSLNRRHDRKRKYEQTEEYAMEAPKMQYLEQRQSHADTYKYKEQRYTNDDTRAIPRHKEQYSYANDNRDYSRNQHEYVKENKREGLESLKSEVRYLHHSDRGRHKHIEQQHRNEGYVSNPSYRPINKESKPHYNRTRHDDDEIRQHRQQATYENVHYEKRSSRDNYNNYKTNEDVPSQRRQTFVKRTHTDYSSHTDQRTQHRDHNTRGYSQSQSLQYKQREASQYNQTHDFHERRPHDTRYSESNQTKRNYDAPQQVDKYRNQDTYFKRNTVVTNRNSYGGDKVHYSSSHEQSYNRRPVDNRNIDYRDKVQSVQRRHNNSENMNSTTRNYSNQNYQSNFVRKYPPPPPGRYNDRGQSNVKRPYQTDYVRKSYEFSGTRKPGIQTQHHYKESGFQPSRLSSYGDSKSNFNNYNNRNQDRNENYHHTNPKEDYRRPDSRSSIPTKSSERFASTERRSSNRGYLSKSKTDLNYRQSSSHREDSSHRRSKHRSHERKSYSSSKDTQEVSKSNQDEQEDKHVATLPDALEVDWVSTTESQKEEKEPIPVDPNSIMRKFTPANLLKECGIMEHLLPDYLVEKVSTIIENSEQDQNDSSLSEHLTSISNNLNCQSDSKFRQYLNGKSRTYPHKLIPPLIINARTYDMSFKHYTACMESPREV